MEESYPCGRRISHKCRYREKSKLIIIANDYSDFEPITTLSAAINDVSMIWNLFRRHFCFHKEQIFVYGQVNIKGKMIAWKERFNIKDPKNIFDHPDSNDQIYFYYSGHGYDDGRLDINPNLEAKLIRDKLYLIVDACYSHLWHIIEHSSMTGFIGATNCERDIAASTKLISSFTLNFAKFITQASKVDDSLESFKEWIKEQQYSFICSQEEIFVKDFLV